LAVGEQVLPEEHRRARVVAAGQRRGLVVEEVARRVEVVADVYQAVAPPQASQHTLSGDEQDIYPFTRKQETLREPGRCQRVSVRIGMSDNSSRRFAR